MMGVPQKIVPFVNRKHCHQCGENINPRKKESFAELEIFDDPWLDKPSIVRVHVGNEDEYGSDCLDVLFDTSYADFRYFKCAECGRIIIRQCPYNGWRSYCMCVDGEEVCVRCVQKKILKEGCDENLIGDFYSYSELSKNGWTELESVFINSSQRMEAMKARCLGLMKSQKVLINYESMAIGGSEGTVSIWTK